MRSRHESERFLCPQCKKQIELKEVIGKLPVTTACKMIAACQDCERAYSAEEWRQRYGTFDPYQDVDF